MEECNSISVCHEILSYVFFFSQLRVETDFICVRDGSYIETQDNLSVYNLSISVLTYDINSWTDTPSSSPTMGSYRVSLG